MSLRLKQFRCCK